ncbi:MAG: hypothetical protein IK097_04380 [Clostridia bacterium]|nr:hypothetical protein [Clostridia bacterium]
MSKIISALIAFLTAVFCFGTLGSYNYEFDASAPGDTVGNKVSNINVWEMGTSFYNAENAEENDIYDFVEYVQLMQCTGGNAQRDLFRDPADRTVLDDYDFTRLVENCRGILRLGAKPCLKLGNIPSKLSANPETGGFEVNVRPPENYDVYYNYISAMAKALVDEFGKDEVLTWRFTMFTEYENSDWFDCGTPEKTAEEFCKIYDYSVQALIDNIGENVCVGAHSMTTTEGLWDEQEFIRHCASGTNYATGSKGSRLNYLTASYYENEPGKTGKRKSLKDTVDFLRNAAEKNGLTNLFYGIDEGRVLSSAPGKESSELLSRTVGFQWQAAFDARIYACCIENDIDYFSMWTYKSDGLNSGNPTLSFHVANLISKWKNARILKSDKKIGGFLFGSEVKAVSSIENGKLRVMAYNYKNKLDYDKTAKLNIKIKNLPLADGKLKATVYTIDENCNYFDDWIVDREKYNIGDDCFDWSPDCPNIGGSLRNADARTIYYDKLEKEYAEKSALISTETELEVKNGTLLIPAEIKANNVVFFEIEPA